jgi:phage protein D
VTAAADPIRAPVECVIKVDDQEVTSLYRYVTRVEVHMSRGAATTCTIELDTFADEHGTWLVEDQDLFVPWKKLVVEAHFADHQEEVMRGYIRETNAQHPADGERSTVSVTAQDESMLLDRAHVRRVWSTADDQMSDGQIAGQIADDANLDSETDDGLSNASLNQDGTAADFLRRRAQANGFELYFRAGKLYFHAIRLETEAQPTMMVHAGPATNCLSFSARYDGHKPDRVRVERAADTGTDVEAQVFEPNLTLLGTTAADSASRGLDPFEWAMTQPAGATRAEADARAQAAANDNAWKIEATGELDGALYGHVLLTHATVEVDGVGDTHGGRYYVDDVTHTFSSDGYRQSFKLLRNATGRQG